MSKLGSPYQDVVSAVAAALHPGASITVGDWIDGPDGEREIDVRVEGIKDGARHFVLIECKDWKRPVGIAAFDALDSKRRDLGAGEAMLFSNSGFSKEALAKAARVGIAATSALIADDRRVRLAVNRLAIAKSRGVRRASLKVYPIPAHEDLVPTGFDWRGITLDGLPLLNWAEKESMRLLQEIDTPCVIAAHYSFRSPATFTINAASVDLKGLSLFLECTYGLVCQTVRVDVTTGLFEHLRKRVVVPPQQGYIYGPFDREAWQPYDGPLPSVELEAGTFEMALELYNPLAGDGTSASPDIDALVSEREINGFANTTFLDCGLTTAEPV